MTPVKSALYETIYQTATGFLADIDKDKLTKDLSTLSAHLSPDCRRYIAPVSLHDQLPSLKEGFTNTAYEQWFAPEIGVWKEWHIETTNTVVDEYERKAAVNIISHLTTHAGAKWDFEFSYFLSMTEDGKAIERVDQKVDTALAERFVAAMKKDMPHLDQTA